MPTSQESGPATPVSISARWSDPELTPPGDLVEAVPANLSQFMALTGRPDLPAATLNRLVKMIDSDRLYVIREARIAHLLGRTKLPREHLLKGALLGSTPYRLVHLSDRPVLVVRAPD